METFFLGLSLGIIVGMLLIAAVSSERIRESDSLVVASRKSLRKAEKIVEDQNEEIINLTNNLELVTNSYEELKEKLEKGQPDSEIPEQKKEAISSKQTKKITSKK